MDDNSKLMVDYVDGLVELTMAIHNDRFHHDKDSRDKLLYLSKQVNDKFHELQKVGV